MLHFHSLMKASQALSTSCGKWLFIIRHGVLLIHLTADWSIEDAKHMMRFTTRATSHDWRMCDCGHNCLQFARCPSCLQLSRFSDTGLALCQVQTGSSPADEAAPTPIHRPLSARLFWWPAPLLSIQRSNHYLASVIVPPVTLNIAYRLFRPLQFFNSLI